MAIKILISVEGSEAVNAAFQGMAKNAENFIGSLQGLGQGKSPLEDFTSHLQDAKPHIDAASEATHGFAEALRVVIPSLRVAGVEVGNFAGFARLASVGIGGLAVAIGSAIVVALATFEDSMKKTRGTLEDLFGSQALGQQAFEGLRKTAQDLGTTVSQLAPGFEALTAAWNKFIESTRTFKFVAPKVGDILPSLGNISTTVGSVKNLADSYSNFLKILRAGRLDEDEATKAAAAFFKILQDGGKVTEQALRGLPTGSIQLLAQAFGLGIENAEQFVNQVKLAPIPMDKLLEALGRFGPQANEAFKTNAIITYKDKLGEIVAALQEGFKTISGTTFSDAIVGFLEKVRQSISKTKEEIQLFVDTWTAFKNLFPSLPPMIGGTQNVPLPLPRPTEAQALPSSFIAAPQPEQISQAIDQIDQEVSPEVEGLGKKWADELFGKPWADALQQNQDRTLSSLEALSNAPLNSDAMIASWTTVTDAVKQLWQSTYDQIVQIFSNPVNVTLQSSGATGGPLFSGFAGGGLIRGPGSSTSDSILARLSDREFILNARAVSFYGADLLHALNSMRIPRDYFQGFNMGGMVRAMVNSLPGFAQGGQMQTAGTPITLVIDSQKFSMTGSADTVKALSRFAVHRQISSTGRKPSWVK